MTQSDILGLQRIFQPQFDSLSAQLSDLKETINKNAEAVQLENERRRKDIGDLYEKIRTLTDDLASLGRDIAILEEWKCGHDKIETDQAQRQQFTTAQRLVLAGVLVSGLIGLLDLATKFLGGK